MRGEAGLAALDRGGLEPLDADPPAFAAALRRENHTLKRALTDPGIFAGIGNAYSDEILHAARLSPVKLTQRLDDEEVARLHQATRQVLNAWTEALRREAAGALPGGGHRLPGGDGGARPTSGSPARPAARRCSGSCGPRTR